jgi:hypothetical protein
MTHQKMGRIHDNVAMALIYGWEIIHLIRWLFK